MRIRISGSSYDKTFVPGHELRVIKAVGFAEALSLREVEGDGDWKIVEVREHKGMLHITWLDKIPPEAWRCFYEAWDFYEFNCGGPNTFHRVVGDRDWKSFEEGMRGPF